MSEDCKQCGTMMWLLDSEGLCPACNDLGFDEDGEPVYEEGLVLIKFTFEDHLYNLVRHSDEKVTVGETVEEWLWFVEENGLEINNKSLEGYTKAVLTCNGWIEE